jgi:hypothetical protein
MYKAIAEAYTLFCGSRLIGQFYGGEQLSDRLWQAAITSLRAEKRRSMNMALSFRY